MKQELTGKRMLSILAQAIESARVELKNTTVENVARIAERGELRGTQQTAADCECMAYIAMQDLGDTVAKYLVAIEKHQKKDTPHLTIVGDS